MKTFVQNAAEISNVLLFFKEVMISGFEWGMPQEIAYDEAMAALRGMLERPQQADAIDSRDDGEPACFIAEGDLKTLHDAQFYKLCTRETRVSSEVWSNMKTPLYLHPRPADAAKAHVLWQRGDIGLPDVVQDRNGDVTLGLCKVCGRGESELVEPCVVKDEPEYKRTAQDDVAAFGIGFEVNGKRVAPGCVHVYKRDDTERLTYVAKNAYRESMSITIDEKLRDVVVAVNSFSHNAHYVNNSPNVDKSALISRFFHALDYAHMVSANSSGFSTVKVGSNVERTEAWRVVNDLRKELTT